MFIDFVEAMQGLKKFNPSQPRESNGRFAPAGRDANGIVNMRPTQEVRSLVRDHLDDSKANMKRFDADVRHGVGRGVEVDGKPVAFGWAKRTLAGSDIWEMGHVVTHPEHRGHGYAKKIMDSLELEARKRGANAMLLCAENDKVISMYEKNGYKLIDEDLGLFKKSLRGIKRS